AKTTMYWGSHLNTSQVRIHRWGDSDTQIAWNDVNINSYARLNRDGVATSPDGTNWAARADSRMTGAWVANGIIGLMWPAKQGGQFPYPYTIIARFNESSRALVSQNELWSSQTAWLFPTASVNSAGNLAGMVMFGGGAFYPGTNIWISDDVQSGFNPLTLYGATESTSGPSRNQWGDYHTVHPHKDSPNTWVGATYYIQNGGENSNAVPRYLWFGRERDFTCTSNISPTSQSFASGGGTGSVGVTSSTTTCNWSSVSNASWITINSGATGSGNGSVSYTVAANSTSAARTGTLTIAGRIFTVSQAASSCTFSISPTSASAGAGGLTSTVAVTTTAGCAWSSVSNVSWITINSGATGSGNGSVSYTVAANSSTATRTGTLTIAGRTFTVTQAAGSGGGGCTSSPISFGQTVNGTLQSTDCNFSDGSLYDTYTFNGTAGQSVIISMNSSAFDTYLFLLSPAGAVLASDDDGGSGTNSRIPSGTGGFTLPTTGTYRILANSFAPNTTGAYQLRLDLNVSCPQTPINVGQTVGGTLSASDCRFSDGSFYDTYTFNAAGGQQIAVAMSAAFDTYLLLLFPDGSLLTFDDDGGDGNNSRIPADSGFITLPAAGTYRIIANSFSGSVTGSYTLSLLGGSSASALKAVYVGQSGDFDADGRDDRAVWRASAGAWFVVNSSNGSVTSRGWGTQGDIPVAGDYDGDQRADLTVWRPDSGAWFIISSSTGVGSARGWGTAGDIPVPGDYDGDRRADLAVWRPDSGAWFIINSSTNTVTSRGWGSGEDIPVPGDYDGDGRTDLAVWRPSAGAWFIINSSNGSVTSRGWGAQGDIPVPGDYDGDKRTDIAVWRPDSGAWFIISSSTGVGSARGWGTVGDTPVPSDYDGDGRDDLAVWRGSAGAWFIINSSTNTTIAPGWGSESLGDVPVTPSLVKK
ncbi:MAG: FG-GAP-like repeat-containing protein, partial [Pyrinomonadaceae bacterium]